jgi:hypothetical protein
MESEAMCLEAGDRLPELQHSHAVLKPCVHGSSNQLRFLELEIGGENSKQSSNAHKYVTQKFLVYNWKL